MTDSQTPPGPHFEDTPPPTAFGSSSSPASSWKQTALLVGGLAALAWGFFFLGQWGAGALATQLPYSVDQTVGEAAAEQLMADEEICTNPVLVGAVEAIVSQLGSEVDSEYHPLEVTVVRSKDINAFALPGGKMFVLTGLLEALESPEELAGVMGHEIGHVVHRHGIRRIAESVWIQFLVSQMFGDVGSFGGALANGAIELLGRKFGRDDERESDEFGVDLMQKAGIAIGNYPAFFDRLPSDVPEWFSTHPNPSDRADEIREMAKEGSVSGAFTLPSLEDLKAPCHARDE